MNPASPPDRVDAVRAFNRFYTRVIGVLDEGLLQTDYSLTEARVLYELAQGDSLDVGALREAVAIDAGYLSRILARFEKYGLVRRGPSETDARRRVVRLTAHGRSVSGTLDRRSAREIGALVAVLGGIDGFVFTAGIGENSPEVRRRICEARSWLGLELDLKANSTGEQRISTPRSKVSTWVVPTNEELMIARHTGSLLGLATPALTR